MEELGAAVTLDLEHLEENLRNQGIFNNDQVIIDDGKTNPRDITIREQDTDYFVQILFILREASWESNIWLSFRPGDLKLHIRDNHYHVYTMPDNIGYFGAAYVDEFPQKVDEFIDLFCKELD